MTARLMSSWPWGWPTVLCLAVACAGCSTSMKTEPQPSAPDVAANPPQSEVVPVPAPVAQSVSPSPSTPAASKGAQELERGIHSYEEGEYKTAAKELQTALDLGLDTKTDQAKAHKYLAFITCVSGREKSCRAEFGKALDADPQFELEPAEAGHPVWSAVLRRVKAQRAAKSKPK
jgi:Tfp pilus assembly protein PilF